MSSSSIDVAPDVVGETVPAAVSPVGTFVLGTTHYQVVMQSPVPPHDYRDYTWTGGKVTQIVYKTGGASGATVATYTATYNGDEIDTEAWAYE
jgi:hypothetical protein